MWYGYRFRAYPERTGVAAEAERHIDIHRQAYNHTRYEYNTLDTHNIGLPREYQRLTYSQSGFELNEKGIDILHAPEGAGILALGVSAHAEPSRERLSPIRGYSGLCAPRWDGERVVTPTVDGRPT